ncbi:putative RNA pseudouridylate synthase [Neospora caninum Liverpool]|uniref:Putative RNA pseudouridylate synthase n=1 Tax=Neospora caninum (strain Liverpool) TaxID=572307 RepID=F0VN71_NEOCL|nr:putative RNA pseudouridylate synthase [Neospora caninum Liverpool]CBZ55167.1 putative RNA pseudouridylate synthase [Neospora caninum Liverpool]CEL69894.1 TPA: RNA pseudouridylate synthase, putative [Neospora caninum Liverpool]|eukprot:XP_003885195.1 putative RNA pseudouridylate synthase [Neospora caninum Liverpool]
MHSAPQAPSFLLPLLRPPVPETLLLGDCIDDNAKLCVSRKCHARALRAELLHSWEALWVLLCKRGRKQRLSILPLLPSGKSLTDSLNDGSSPPVAEENPSRVSGLPQQVKGHEQRDEQTLAGDAGRRELSDKAANEAQDASSREEKTQRSEARKDTAGDDASAEAAETVDELCRSICRCTAFFLSLRRKQRQARRSDSDRKDNIGDALPDLPLLCAARLLMPSRTKLDAVERPHATGVASGSAPFPSSSPSSLSSSPSCQCCSPRSLPPADSRPPPGLVQLNIVHCRLDGFFSTADTAATAAAEAAQKEPSEARTALASTVSARRLHWSSSRVAGAEGNGRYVSLETYTRPDCLGSKLLHQALANCVSRSLRAYTLGQQWESETAFEEKGEGLSSPRVCCVLRGLKNLRRPQWAQAAAVLVSILADAAACASAAEQSEMASTKRREGHAGTKGRGEPWKAQSEKLSRPREAREDPESGESEERGEKREHTVEEEEPTEAGERQRFASPPEREKLAVHSGPVSSEKAPEEGTERSEERCGTEANPLRVLLVLEWGGDDRPQRESGEESGSEHGEGLKTRGGTWARHKARLREDVAAWVRAANRSFAPAVRVHFLFGQPGEGQRTRREGMESAAEAGKKKREAEEAADQATDGKERRGQEVDVEHRTDERSEHSSSVAFNRVGDGRCEGTDPPNLGHLRPAVKGDVSCGRNVSLLSLLRDGEESVKRPSMLFLGGHDFFPAPPVGSVSTDSPLALSSLQGAPGELVRQLEDLVYLPLLLRSRLSASSGGASTQRGFVRDPICGARDRQRDGQLSGEAQLLRDCNSLLRDPRGFLPPPPRLLLHSCRHRARRRDRPASSPVSCSFFSGASPPGGCESGSRSAAAACRESPSRSATRRDAESVGPQGLIQVVAEKYSACIQTFLLPLTAIESPYVGQTEEKLRRLLKVAANASPSVLVLLGIDQLGRKRERGGDTAGVLAGVSSDETQTGDEEQPRGQVDARRSRVRAPSGSQSRDGGCVASEGKGKVAHASETLDRFAFTDRQAGGIAAAGVSPLPAEHRDRRWRRTARDVAACAPSAGLEDRGGKGGGGRREGRRTSSFQRRLLAALLVALDEIEDNRRRHEQRQSEEAEDAEADIAEPGSVDPEDRKNAGRKRDVLGAAAGMAIIGVAKGSPDTLDEAVVRAGRLDNWVSWC